MIKNTLQVRRRYSIPSIETEGKVRDAPNQRLWESAMPTICDHDDEAQIVEPALRSVHGQHHE